MAVELRVPEVGESITEVQIGAWLKGEGDRVERDEAVVEIESDKATLELPAPVSGTIEKLLKKKGDVVKIGELIATLAEGAGGRLLGLQLRALVFHFFHADFLFERVRQLRRGFPELADARPE